MQEWSNFYFLCGSSAAGLTGLMFIAVTFGSKFVREDNQEQVNVFLGSICLHFMQVFFLCCIASVPTVGEGIMALVTSLSGLYRLSRMPNTYRVMRASSKNKAIEVDREDWLVSFVFPTIIFCGLVVNGLIYFIESFVNANGEWAIADSLFAAEIIALLLLGAKGAWNMVVWMASKIEIEKKIDRPEV